jgi:predicted nucleotidyltransferase
MKYSQILKDHKALSLRRNNSDERLSELKKKFREHGVFNDTSISVFCAGSLGRGDSGIRSDLDLFVISGKAQRSRLEDLTLFARVIEINDSFSKEKISNDGEYLKIYPIAKMLEVLGQPTDDSDNMFTARMLMLLESQPVTNVSLYDRLVTEVLEHYFRDSDGKDKFRPLFLLNDLLRYWRTLCLNYEKIRNDPGRPWWKKNINLKFSRMITVFGTVLPLIAMRNPTEDDVYALVQLSPLERFAKGLDESENTELLAGFSGFLDAYEQFLAWKEDPMIIDRMNDVEFRESVASSAKLFSDYIYTAITGSQIDRDLVKYLVI